MLQRSFYLPEDLYRQLKVTAGKEGVPTAELIRQLLEESLKEKTQKKLKTTQFLLKLATYKLKKAPKDLARHHDKYIWE